MSKTIAKWSTGAQINEQPRTDAEVWLMSTVQRLAQKAGIGMPDVCIYDGAPNAFATGAFKNSALVAVSTGLLQSMNKEEVEAVLGHEIAHVANGDMVTLTLIQGVVNTFVIFLARVVGSIVDRAVFRSERGNGPGYFISVLVLEIVFGVGVDVVVFSRQQNVPMRVPRLGSPTPMVNALRRLAAAEPGELPKALKAFGITERSGIMALFATHPPIEVRIAALQGRVAES
jgi:heat shock protein HtpX